MLRLAHTLFALGLLSACDPGTQPLSGERALEVGTGTWRFEPLEDGQQVDMVRGAQGGWHVWVSLRASGVEEGEGMMTLTLQPADESREPAVTTVRVSLDPPDSQGRRSFLGWPGILEDPSCQLGELLRVEVQLDISDAEEPLVAERMVTPLGGTYPPPACE